MLGEFNYIEKNIEKWKGFLLPMKIKIIKESIKIEKTLQKLYPYSFVIESESLSNLFVNFAEESNKTKCRYEHYNKKYQTIVFKSKDCECFLQYSNVKDNLVVYICFCCNRKYQKKFEEELKKRFSNTHYFSNQDINKFTLLLLKVV